MLYLSFPFEGVLFPNNLLIPDLLEGFLGFAGVFLSSLAACLAACLASSLGDVLDFCTEEGKSASAGDGLGLLLPTAGGDFVKKLKSELCFAIISNIV